MSEVECNHCWEADERGIRCCTFCGVTDERDRAVKQVDESPAQHLVGALKERLLDWTDFDVAGYQLGVVLGLLPEWPKGEAWGPHKWVFWSANPLGDALYEMLRSLVTLGVLERSGEAFRWVGSGALLDEGNAVADNPDEFERSTGDGAYEWSIQSEPDPVRNFRLFVSVETEVSRFIDIEECPVTSDKPSARRMEVEDPKLRRSVVVTLDQARWLRATLPKAIAKVEAAWADQEEPT